MPDARGKNEPRGKALRGDGTLADVRRVSPSVLRIFLCLLAVLSFASCERYVTERSSFWKVISTDYEGNVISEWIAAGHPWRIEGGVRIRAIQKTTYDPHPVEVRYAISRRVEVTAANVTFFRTKAPAWFRESTVVTESQTVVSSYAK